MYHLRSRALTVTAMGPHGHGHVLGAQAQSETEPNRFKEYPVHFHWSLSLEEQTLQPGSCPSLRSDSTSENFGPSSAI